MAEQIRRQNKHEFINYARAMAGLPSLDNLSTNQSEEARKALLFFDATYATLLSKAPWNFATKRARLKRASTNPVESYANLYDTPDDGLFLWDIYNYGAEALSQVNFYCGTKAYRFYAFPLYDGFQFGDRVAEIIGGKIASDFSELSVLYTPNIVIPLTHVSQQFYDTLRLDLEEAFMKDRASDEDTLNKRMRTNQAYKRENKALAGLENRKARSIPDPKIIQNIRTRMRR